MTMPSALGTRLLHGVEVSGHPSGDFEALLRSVLDVAFRLAYSLTCNRAGATVLVEEAAVLACRQRETLGAGMHFKTRFLGLLTEQFYSVECAASSPILSDGLDDDLHRALGSLSLGERVVNALQLVGDLRYQDIATVLDLPVSTVRTRLHRGRARIRQALSGTAAALH